MKGTEFIYAGGFQVAPETETKVVVERDPEQTFDTLAVERALVEQGKTYAVMHVPDRAITNKSTRR